MTEAGGEWAFSDAWLMTGVAISGDDGCDLPGLIAAADCCNHAILMTNELAQGVGRLAASGLLAHDDTTFRLTDEGKRLADRRKGSMFSQVNSVHRLLAGAPLTEGRWAVTDQQVDVAYAAYMKRQHSKR